MRAIVFELFGKTAHFRRPDMNNPIYFSYNHIHKVALLGMLGAILGLEGHKKSDVQNELPEFYKKLERLEISIVPLTDHNGIFSKKNQVFNNSVGYASQEQQNNLVVVEQWIEYPRWKIFINLESEIEKNLLDKLINSLLNSQAVYLPYLGKNDHYANISDVRLLELQKLENPDYISSLFMWEKVSLDKETYDYSLPYTFKDTMPIGLNKEGMYEFNKIGLTNRLVISVKKTIYSSGFENLFFI